MKKLDQRDHLAVTGGDAQQGGRKNLAELIFKGYWSQLLDLPRCLDKKYYENARGCLQMVIGRSDATQHQNANRSYHYLW